MLKEFRKSLAKFIFDKKEKSKNVLDMHKINSILILRDDNKIGDMIITTILFREIKKAYPHIKIFVLCGNSNKIILENNPYIDKIFISDNKFLKDIFVYSKLRKHKIDLLVDFWPFGPKPMHFLKLRIINSKFLLGICKQKYNIYDISVNVNYNVEHISKIYTEILHSLNIKNVNINYDIFLDKKYEDYAKTVIEQNDNKKYLFFNTHSASKWRTLSLDKTKEILQMLYKYNFKIILNSQYDINDENIIVTRKDNFLYVLALIKYSDIILTTDTSIVHAANAFDKKMISLYVDSSDREEKLSQIWAPNYRNGIQLLSKPKKNISSIETSQIEDAIKNFLN